MKTLQKSISISIVLVLLLIQSSTLSANEVSQARHLAISGLIEVSWSQGQFYPSFLRGHMQLPPGIQSAKEDDVAASEAFLQQYATVFGISQINQELQVVDQMIDSLDIGHVVWQQMYHSLPVYNSLIKVHIDRSANEVIAVGNGFVSGINLMTTSPQIDADNAIAVGQRLQIGGKLQQQPELVIFPGVGSQLSAQSAKLAWLVEMKGTIAHNLFVIDALDGKLLDVLTRSYELLQSDAIAANAADDLSNYDEGVAKRLATYSAGNTENLPGTLMRIDDEPPVGDTDLDNAHAFADQTLRYYLDTFNRNSIDDKGAVISSTVHYGKSVQNAYFTGDQMVYGDGMAALDVAGHELSHGITYHTANLEYRWQSGALNESFSDIIAAMIDREDWLIGEDVGEIFGQEALRDMADPSRFGQPGQAKDWSTTCLDYEGVHINSGIFNKAYYEIATSISKEKAEQIFYRTLVLYLQPTSTFLDARNAVLQATSELYPDAIDAVKTGFEVVGMNGTWEPPANNCSCLATASVTGQNATETLDTLYQLRDTVMAQTSTGNYYVRLFYQSTARISALLNLDPNLRSETNRLISLFEPGLQNLVAGQGDNTVITQQMVDDVRTYLNQLKVEATASGDNELVQTIETQEARIDWFRLPGMTFAEAWEYIDSLGGIFSVLLPSVQR